LSKAIWERRLELERQIRAEREERLQGLHEKYEPALQALREECEQTAEGHKWRFTTLGVVGQLFFSCNFCGKTRVEDPNG